MIEQLLSPISAGGGISGGGGASGDDVFNPFSDFRKNMTLTQNISGGGGFNFNSILPILLGVGIVFLAWKLLKK